MYSAILKHPHCLFRLFHSESFSVFYMCVLMCVCVCARICVCVSLLVCLMMSHGSLKLQPLVNIFFSSNLVLFFALLLKLMVLPPSLPRLASNTQSSLLNLQIAWLTGCASKPSFDSFCPHSKSALQPSTEFSSFAFQDQIPLWFVFNLFIEHCT